MLSKVVGLHVSSAEGLVYAAVTSRSLGVQVFQTMVGEPVSWSPYKFPDSSVNEFRKLSYGMRIYVHLPYTINPCLSPDERLFKAQRAVYRKYLEVSERIGAHSVVIHPGFRKGLAEGAALKNLIKFFAENPPEGGLRVLLETDSGSRNGSAIGSLEFIRDALEALGRDSYGMVMDTEHLYARGVDVWDEEVRKDLLRDFGHLIEMVHLNAPDEGVSLGSYLDRHSIPFQEYPRDSGSMIKDLSARFPLIVERKSISVAEKDIEYVRSLQ